MDIGTDSRYGMLMFGLAGRCARARGWRNSRGKLCSNRDLVQLALAWRDRYGYAIRFTHIYAHTGLSDERSAGNENADKLAVAGAEKWGRLPALSQSVHPPLAPHRPRPHLDSRPVMPPTTHGWYPTIAKCNL